MAGELIQQGSEIASNVLEIVIQRTLGWSVAPFRRVIEDRRREALEALQEELRLGNITEEEFTSDAGNVASVLRLLQCADEGTARLNLKLLARVITGQHRVGPRVTDEFQRWAAILASLTHEEIAVLGRLHHFTSEARKVHPSDTTARAAEALSSTRNSLVGGQSVFGGDSDAFEATLAGLVRTGLVVPVSGFGAISYRTTSLLDRLAVLIEWEAFADEAIESSKT